MRLCPVLALVLAASVAVFATAQPKIIGELRGKVIGISDGDTIKILVDRKPVTVRLEGIDAPEAKQAFGSRARQALGKLVAGKSATVQVTGTDRYGRTLGIVMLGDLDVNAKLVEDGWAWHFKKYSSDQSLAELEKDARSARRGLWADPNPLAPWDYRARKRTVNALESSGSPVTAYWLNTSSGVRHNQSCEHFKNTKRGRLCGPTDGKACGICGG